MFVTLQSESSDLKWILFVYEWRKFAWNLPNKFALFWNRMSTVLLLCKLLCTTSIPQKSKFFHNRIFTLMKMIVIWKKNSFPVASLFLEGILTLTRKTKIHSSVISSSSLICYARHFSAPVLFLSWPEDLKVKPTLFFFKFHLIGLG